jgi:hypothetical protein
MLTVCWHNRADQSRTQHSTDHEQAVEFQSLPVEGLPGFTDAMHMYDSSLSHVWHSNRFQLQIIFIYFNRRAASPAVMCVPLQHGHLQLAPRRLAGCEVCGLPRTTQAQTQSETLAAVFFTLTPKRLTIIECRCAPELPRSQQVHAPACCCEAARNRTVLSILLKLKKIEYVGVCMRLCLGWLYDSTTAFRHDPPIQYDEAYFVVCLSCWASVILNRL